MDAVQVGVVDKGGTRRTPPSAAIRVHRRLRHLADAGVVSERLDPGSYAGGEGSRRDVLVVVRDALPVEHLDAVLRRVQREGTRLVLDLDDDLLTDVARARLVGQGYDDARLDAVGAVARAADVVLVSTPHVRDLVASSTGAPVEVVVNELDPALWTRAADAPGLPTPDPAELRLLYMGSRTHEHDLALLDGLPESVGALLGRPTVLEVVGVTTRELSSPGVRSLDPPQPHYAGFVRWLRAHQGRWAAAVAPLVDEPFNHAKSDLKLLEYGALDLPAAASLVGPYRSGDPDLRVGVDGLADWPASVAEAVRDRTGPDWSARRAAAVGARSMSQESLARWKRLVVSPAAG